MLRLLIMKYWSDRIWKDCGDYHPGRWRWKRGFSDMMMMLLLEEGRRSVLIIPWIMHKRCKTFS